jgi:GNAT superfamily N-acetyltransferase
VNVAPKIPATALSIAPIEDTDVADVVALWRACDLTRPWNDPEADIALARRRPNSTVLIGRNAVAVDPNRRAQGLGRSIMNAAEDWLRKAGIAKLQLLVRRSNAKAGAFYQSLGYTEAETIVFAKWLDGREPTP